jgi:hypothetical protein
MSEYPKIKRSFNTIIHEKFEKGEIPLKELERLKEMDKRHYGYRCPDCRSPRADVWHCNSGNSWEIECKDCGYYDED